jgi:hypothetical protein
MCPIVVMNIARLFVTLGMLRSVSIHTCFMEPIVSNSMILRKRFPWNPRLANSTPGKKFLNKRIVEIVEVIVKSEPHKMRFYLIWHAR